MVATASALPHDYTELDLHTGELANNQTYWRGSPTMAEEGQPEAGHKLGASRMHDLMLA